MTGRYNPFLLLADETLIHKDQIKRIKVKHFNVVGVVDDTIEYGGEVEIEHCRSIYEATEYINRLNVNGYVTEYDMSDIVENGNKLFVKTLLTYFESGTLNDKTMIELFDYYRETHTEGIVEDNVCHLIKTGHLIEEGGYINMLPYPTEKAVSNMVSNLFVSNQNDRVGVEHYDHVIKCHMTANQDIFDYPDKWGDCVLSALCSLGYAEQTPARTHHIDGSVSENSMWVKILKAPTIFKRDGVRHCEYHDIFDAINMSAYSLSKKVKDETGIDSRDNVAD